MQRNIYPQEKLHVVTDRDVYCGGDTVWFRIFVVDAATHQQVAMSKYAYVEMLNPFGKVQTRVKVMEHDGVYAGYMPVCTDIFEGDYTLAAYTEFAENQGQEYFFKKPLKLLSLHSDKYDVDSRFTKKSDNVLSGVFKLTKSHESNVSAYKVSFTMPDGKYFEIPSNREFSRDFNIDKGDNAVLLRYKDYGIFIPIENQDEDSIHIEFYPEGGWLIEGNPCRVAFKATDSSGKGIDASGTVYEKNGQRITEFKTTHNGMGSFTFIPQPGMSYHAEYSGSGLKRQMAEIGKAKNEAAALRYNSTGTKSTFSMAGGNGRPLELVVACRGLGLFSIPLSSEDSFSIDKTELPTGLHQAFLVSPADNTVVSERLFFIGADRRAQSPETFSLSSDSTTLRLNAQSGNPADCSVKIVRQNMHDEDNYLDIFTQMLLQSELRGRIENPNYYFCNPDRETEQNLDLLMMVNGWSRYNMPEVIRGHYEEPEIPLEIGQEITGQVRSRWRNKPFEGVMVNAIVPKKNFGTFADTDTDGIFRLNGFDFPENTLFILKAMNENGDNELNYDIFSDSFPTIEKLNIYIPKDQDVVADILAGNQWRLLDEVDVTARSQSGAGIYGLDEYETLASYSCSANDFKAKGISSIEEAMRIFPGITTMMGYLKWRNRYVAYYLDGRFFQPSPNASSGFGKGPTVSEVNALIPFEDIERIDFVRPENASVLGQTYSGGAVMIITKQGNKTSWGKQFELKDHIPLGYQEYKEYASPMLSIDAEENDRKNHKTLLWLPSVKFDETGKTIDLRFPVETGDKVVVEGISDNGNVIYKSF